ncbi:hypothetical protein K501DRAFT_312902 [Backusella circina FSU 941]|nr:hypothetical protein K501DRAFT_312902 [Backusella circina FSU 941]
MRVIKWIALLCAIKMANCTNADVISKGDCSTPKQEETCHYECGKIPMQSFCVSGRCFCTNVGNGDCKDENDEGCESICKSMNKIYKGCEESKCICN